VNSDLHFNQLYTIRLKIALIPFGTGKAILISWKMGTKRRKTDRTRRETRKRRQLDSSGSLTFHFYFRKELNSRSTLEEMRLLAHLFLVAHSKLIKLCGHETAHTTQT